MYIRTVLHEQYQEDFRKGIESKMQEIKGMGFDAARDKFNIDNPICKLPDSLGSYYFASGELEALVQSI